MTLERLQALPRYRIPELDGVVRRTRRERAVWRKRDRVDEAAMALERLSTGAPVVYHLKEGCNPLWNIIYHTDHGLLRCENDRRAVQLEWCYINT